MSQYHFVTKWKIEAPLPLVWDMVYNVNAWQKWWKGVLQVTELEKGDFSGIGKISEQTWKSVLPYKLRFISTTLEVKQNETISGIAEGDLNGDGTWVFEKVSENITSVAYYWNVETSKSWMNVLAPILRPIFQWNHDKIMQWGAEGIAKELQCKVISLK